MERYSINRKLTVKMSILLRTIADSLQSLSKFQWHFSHKTNNHIICMEPQKTSNYQSNLNKARGIVIPYVYNKAIIIKQYDIGIKEDTQQRETHAYMVN